VSLYILPNSPISIANKLTNFALILSYFSHSIQNQIMKRSTKLDLRNALVEYAETGLLCSSAENNDISPTTLFNQVYSSKPAFKA